MTSTRAYDPAMPVSVDQRGALPVAAPDDSFRTVVSGRRGPPRRSSRIRARVDLTFRLRGEPDTKDPIKLTGYIPKGYEWQRNAPGTADTLTVTLDAEDLPFDLRIIEDQGMLVEGWLYEHEKPEQCYPGAPGYFAGIVDALERNQFDTTVSLEARDYTGFLLDREVTAAELNKFDALTVVSLESIVRRMVALNPGSAKWEIRALTTSAALPLEAIGFVQPTKIEVRQALIQGGKRVTQKVNSNKKVTVGVDSAGNRAETKATQRNAKVSVVSYRVPTPAEILAMRIQFIAGLGSLNTDTKRVKLWQLITDVCARFGVVPEVDVSEAGVGRVTLVDAGALQTSDVFRPFARDKLTRRLFTVGENVATLNERLELAATDRRPDFVVVSSTDPEIGKTYRACWPPGSDTPRAKVKGDRALNGVFQTIEGITNERHLLRLANKAFNALAHNQFTIVVSVDVPWSSGGGPWDPDLLDFGYGAALDLAFQGFDRVGADPTTILARRLGIRRDLAQRIADAGDRIGAMALAFQCVEVTHDWQGGEDPTYQCSFTARQFLGTPDLPIIGDVPRLQESVSRTA